MSLDLPKDHQLRYLNRRAADIEELKLSLEIDNFEVAKMIGHRLKGSGQTFGFPLITTIGSSIELAGQEADKKRILAAIEELMACIEVYLNELSRD